MKSLPEDLKTALGQCFWIGLNGTDVSDGATREIFRTFDPGGIILFQRNVDSIRQVQKMTADLQDLSRIPLFMSIDQEGGTVERLHELIGTIPPAMAFTAARDPGALAVIHGAHARILRGLGFNVDFTPVLDLALSNADNGLGTRCFSDDPRLVVKYAKALIGAFEREKILVCGKHFPGLGDTDLDSHVNLPTVARSWNRIEREDLIPYSALLKHLPFIMVNHALYKDQNKKLPASLAPEIVKDFLLGKWSYEGLAISDDLIMGAVSNFYNLTDSTERALLAGNHLFLICRPENVAATFRDLAQRAISNRQLQHAIHGAAGRILAFKFRRLSRANFSANLKRDCKIMENASRKLAEKAITLQQGRKPSKMPGELTLFLPRTKWLKNGRSGLPVELAGYGCKAREQFFDIAITEADAAALASTSKTQWNLVVTTSLITRAGQKTLIDRLMNADKKVIIVRGAFPNDFAPQNAVMILCAYWTSPAALQAVAKAIAGKIKCAGKNPLHTL